MNEWNYVGTLCKMWDNGKLVFVCFMFEFAKMLVAVHCLCSEAGAAVGV